MCFVTSKSQLVWLLTEGVPQRTTTNSKGVGDGSDLRSAQNNSGFYTRLTSWKTHPIDALQTEFEPVHGQPGFAPKTPVSHSRRIVHAQLLKCAEQMCRARKQSAHPSKARQLAIWRHEVQSRVATDSTRDKNTHKAQLRC